MERVHGFFQFGGFRRACDENPLFYSLKVRRISLINQSRKLITAQAGHNVRLAKGRAQNIRSGHYREISVIVTPRVIYGFSIRPDPHK